MYLFEKVRVRGWPGSNLESGKDESKVSIKEKSIIISFSRLYTSITGIMKHRNPTSAHIEPQGIKAHATYNVEVACRLHTVYV